MRRSWLMLTVLLSSTVLLVVSVFAAIERSASELDLTASRQDNEQTRSMATVAADLQPLVSECQGCHGANRAEPPSRFSNGFGRWQDQQCFGCHQEIVEVANHRAAGVHDPRYLSLPVADARLQQLSQQPLPYLQAPRQLANHAALTAAESSPARFTDTSLLQFLRRPAGRCAESSSNGTADNPAPAAKVDVEQSCSAPLMMAYPQANAALLQALVGTVFTDPVTGVAESDRADASNLGALQPRPQFGQVDYQQRCQSCHQQSAFSRVSAVTGRVAALHHGRAPLHDVALRHDAAGLALFTPEWLQMLAANVANHPDVDAQQALDLHAYFQQVRATREQQVDAAVAKLYQANWPAQPDPALSKPLSVRETQYLWRNFWRDAGCVHCHGIEGRAKQHFDVSADGIERYIGQRRIAQLYFRLQTRTIEQQQGIGASMPGMPMTGAALPKPLINLIGRWIQNGCATEQGTLLCEFQ